MTKDGNNKCTNKGCNKEFKPEDNNETSCNYHKGQPVFHDLKKYWTCCGVISLGCVEGNVRLGRLYEAADLHSRQAHSQARLMYMLSISF